ncbi:MAG: FAD:protein FMN transferase [Odoribacteraceae bacterium]|jgi:thiamine biosynthesis lipoprotein|nr:FAD:protein FMN transferase [Odoribacteraceae bacterium]
MKTRRVLTVCLLLALLAGCRERRYFFHGGRVFGTTYSVRYEHARDLRAGIEAALARVDSSLSMFNEASLLSRLNRDEEAPLDSLFTRVFGQARRVHERTGGAFDITVAPLVEAWGFGRGEGGVPAAREVDSLLSFVGMHRLSLRDGRLVKEKKGIRLDAGAIAKGLGVDEVARFLEGEGTLNYLVEVGGEVRVKGRSERRDAWWVGVHEPAGGVDSLTGRSSRLVAVMRDGALATSGNYRNFRDREGTRFGHTINPLDGYPVQRDIVSASVYASTCMEADAYATAFMVLGLQESRRIVEADPGLEACFIFLDEAGERQTWLSDGFREMLLKE